jgi:glycosyltransferase involved in cell wall biosynthesis
MKILHLSTEDIAGGAARAAFRLNQGLNNLDSPNIDSQMLVKSKLSGASSVISDSSVVAKISPTLNRLPLQKYSNRERVMFSSQWFMDKIAERVADLSPDIVHLHWVCNGFLKIETIKKINRPVVWTLHDMWPLTGGCHYSKTCNRYEHQCGACPMLHSHKQKDLSFHTLQRKVEAWNDIDLTVITPSHWLSDCSKKSAVFKDRRIDVIANGIDVDIFRPGFKQIAREFLNLPQEKKLLLFVAGSTTGDPRKGFRYLAEAVNFLHQKGCDLELVILGEEAPSKPLSWNIKAHYLGKLNDEVSLALVYNASDVFIAPSVQDNLPNTIIEAQACGKPCVAFRIGGMPDMIDHQHNGYLAEPFETSHLAQGIEWILESDDRYKALSQAARDKAVKSFNLKLQVQKNADLYREITAKYK